MIIKGFTPTVDKEKAETVHYIPRYTLKEDVDFNYFNYDVSCCACSSFLYAYCERVVIEFKGYRLHSCMECAIKKMPGLKLILKYQG